MGFSRQKHAQVILPLPLWNSFTYIIPDTLSKHIKNGVRVIVPFGNKKIYTGIVVSIDDPAEEISYSLKEILDVLDDYAIFTDLQLDFFHWISRYYLSPIGNVLNVALPAALKLSSESFVAIHPDANFDNVLLNDREFEILEVLKSTQEMSIKTLSNIINMAYPQKILKQLREKELIDLYQKIKDKYQPKKEKRIKLADQFLKEKSLDKLLNNLSTYPKQEEIIFAYLKNVPVFSDIKYNEKGISNRRLLAYNISPSSLKTLIKKNILIEWNQVISRFPIDMTKENEKIELTDVQLKAKEKIIQLFDSFSTVLLHGVTGSGKTEIYVQLIKEFLTQDQQVLFLLPEIALTTQIVSRLRKFFGDTFNVYHSRHSDKERAEVYQNVATGKVHFVVGVRSAIFLPFRKLALIIIDEEHETSYKQFDATPRYHAREAAIYLGCMHGAKILLGSATPSLESYYNAINDKYGYVQINERHDNAHFPNIQLVDMLNKGERKTLKKHLSVCLFSEITKALEKKEQIILFQNRRGYSSYVYCESCQNIPKCVNCSVTLTYHQFNHKLLCHYCGFNQQMFSNCSNCGNDQLQYVGFGTQELEEEVKIMFPNHIVQRMDLDTTRGKYNYERIIESFEKGEIDILVGTQMIGKGLDFDKVNLVGVFDIDRFIHFPDFRSHEKVFQVVTQVSGRSGRKSTHGQVIVQSNHPTHPLLQEIKNHGYKNFLLSELKERKIFHYPPFCRLVKIIFKHPDKMVTMESANVYKNKLLKKLHKKNLVGPVPPLIGKIKNQYLYEILLKIEKQGTKLQSTKRILLEEKNAIHQIPQFKTVNIVFDVDPV